MGKPVQAVGGGWARIGAGSTALLLLLGMVLSNVREHEVSMEQDGMAIGSGGMPISLSDDSSRSAPNPLLDALESSVEAARSLRQEMGGPSMRVSAGRAALRQLPAKERRRDTARAAETLQNYMAERAKENAEAADTLKNYMAQELHAAQSMQLAASQAPRMPEVSGMALGSGGRPLPMHLTEQKAAWKQNPQQKAQMLELFDRLSPETKKLLLSQKPGLNLSQAAAAVAKTIASSRNKAMRSRMQMLWNAQEKAPYNPMQDVSHFDAESWKVNKMIAAWQSKADTLPAGSYSDY